MGILLIHGSLKAEEEYRLALVIGNGDYAETPLKNPLNDANDMAETLEDLGFEVILRNNATRREMARAIREFGRKLKEKRGVGLFYYAGHGMQIAESNYLIPIGAPMEAEDEIPFESIDVGSVLAKMESAGNALNLMILDACRNNPFPSQFRSTNRGLAQVDAPIGSLVVYSTAPGDVAADGDGRNGVFTGQLLKQLKTKGLSLTETVQRTRAAVVKETNGRQIPWASSSMLKDYYFSPVDDVAPQEQEAAGSVAQEVEFWNAAKLDNTPEAFEAYLIRYPEGLFAELAQFRIAKFLTDEEAKRDAARLAARRKEREQEAARIDAQIAAQKAADDAALLAAKEAADKAAKLAAQQAADEAAQLAARQAAEKAAKLAAQQAAEQAAQLAAQKEADEAAQRAAQQSAYQAAQLAAKKEADKAAQLAAQQEAAKATQLATQQEAQKKAKEATQLAELAIDETTPAYVEVEPQTTQFTVLVTPEDARIRIMNINPVYTPGIKLDRSIAYDVYVTHPGYESFRDNVVLDKNEQTLTVVLAERNLTAPITVPLASGSFTMGCSKGDRLCKSYEKPSHSVSIDAFRMTKTEITVSQYSKFVDATGYVTDAEKNAGGNKGCFIWSDSGGISRSTASWDWKAGTSWRNPGYKQKGNFPATCLSWNDAVAYANWLSNKTGQRYSLPTEAQWEYAARAGSTSRYLSSNDSASLCKHANVADQSLSPSDSKWSNRVSCNDKYWFSAPVASYKANRAGLHDMQGNVWEWVDDVWASSFKNTPRNGLANRSGNSTSRVLRGGAWDGDAKLIRVSNRSKAQVSNRTATTGFRLVVN